MILSLIDDADRRFDAEAFKVGQHRRDNAFPRRAPEQKFDFHDLTGLGVGQDIIDNYPARRLQQLLGGTQVLTDLARAVGGGRLKLSSEEFVGDAASVLL